MLKIVIVALFVASVASQQIIDASDVPVPEEGYENGVVVDLLTPDGQLRNIPSTTCSSAIVAVMGHAACNAHCITLGFRYGRCLGNPYICTCYR